jgi:hypothetical protein
MEFPEPVCLSKMKPTDLSRDWFWHGYLARGTVTLLSALWKSGKTTLLAHLVKALGTGEKLAGLSVSQARVLVVSEEPDGLWPARRDQLGIGDHVDVLVRPFRVKPDWPTWDAFLEHLAGLCSRNKYGIVVLDTLSNLWPVWKENDASEVQAALMPLRRLTDSGSCVLPVHHLRKSGGEEATGSRGSGALASFVDIIVEMRRYDPRNRKDRRRVLSGYGRYADTPDELVIELSADGKRYDAHGDRQHVHQGERRQVIYELLPNEAPGLTVEKVLAAWPDSPKPGLRQLRSELMDGADKGEWRFTGKGVKGDPYRYWLP